LNRDGVLSADRCYIYDSFSGRLGGDPLEATIGHVQLHVICGILKDL
jgi:hypothetical protein